MIIWVQFALNMDTPLPSYVRMMPTNHFRDGQCKKKSHVIISWSFLSFYETLSLVRHRDVEHNSRWSFECNLQEIWTRLRRHTSEWITNHFRDWQWKEKSHVIIYWSFLSDLETLSLVRHRDVEYNSTRSFECNLHEIWTHLRRHMSEWCLQITSKMGNGRKNPMRSFLGIFSLRSWDIISR